MAKKTLSIKVDEEVRKTLEKQASKKEWTLSYFVQSILNNYAKRNKVV